MQAMNRAIEDAAAFTAFRDELMKRKEAIPEASERITGENREQRRARERAEQKAAKRTAAVKGTA